MFQEMLAKEGVTCLVKNDRLSSAVGELPFMECLPELWVLDDEVYPRARLLLDSWLKQEEESSDVLWTCADCGEQCADQFVICWKCFAARD